MKSRRGMLVAFVLLATVLVFAASQAGRASSSGVASKGIEGIAGSLVSSVGVSPDSALSVSWEGLYSDDLPEDFEKEVASGEGRDWITSGQGESAGYFEEGRGVSEVSGECVAALEGKGWTKIESGSDSFVTFVKNGGAYRWLAVGFVEVPSGTSVVFQWSKEGGRGDG